MSRIMKLETGGYGGDDTIVVDSLMSYCGKVKDGITMRHDNQRGGWVLSFRDLERLYFAARLARTKKK